ncbi:MAG: EAL domain-containing protein [Methylobacter sp.]|nr:EAL domain-containing protein [Candidatus Methylobacter titanis]
MNFQLLKYLAGLCRPRFAPCLLSGLILLVGLGITADVCRRFQQQDKEHLHTAFGFAADQAISNIRSRFNAYVTIMRGVKGFVDSSKHISADEFRTYIQALHLDHKAGVQGIGLAKIIAHVDKDHHIADMRQQEKLPGYRIKPEGERAYYSPVIYMEPLNAENLKALGMDILAFPEPLAAAARARDSGDVAITARITLAQDAGKPDVNGFVMYLPIYQGGSKPDSLAQRRAAIAAWVDVPFRINDLMVGLGDQVNSDIVLEIYDAEPQLGQPPLYRSHDSSSAEGLLQISRELAIGGRRWILSMHTTPAFEARVSSHQRLILVGVVGVVLTLVLSVMTWFLLTRGARAQSRFRQLFALAEDGVLVVNQDCRFVEANPASLRMLGYSREQLFELSLSDILAVHEHPRLGAVICQLKAGVTHQAEWMHVRKDKTELPVEVSAHLIEGGLMLGILRDRSEYKKAEAALRESEQRFDQLAGQSRTFTWDVDIEGRYTYVSVVSEAVLGFCPDELVGKKYFYDLHPEQEREQIKDRRLAITQRKEMSVNLENQILTKDGRLIWVSSSGMPLLNADGTVRGYRGCDIDITARKQDEEKLRFAASVFTHAREGIMITEPDGTIVDVNAMFSEITGYSHEEVLGENPRLLTSGRHSKEFYDAFWASLIKQGYWYGEIWNRRKNGEVYASMQTISAVRDAQGNTQHYMALFSDITALKERQEYLEYIANYDVLTNLPNRVLLADRLRQAMVQAQRHKQLLAVAFLDFDGFKDINDHHGHEVGDQLLIALSGRMKQALREGDTLARIGGDEFVAVLVDLVDIDACVPMLTRLLASAAETVQLGDITLRISASLGVTFYPQAEDLDADQLQRQADQAMYKAKQAGKNRYYIFDAEADRSIRGHHESLEHIRQGLINREFMLYYQPKVNMRTGEIIGAEALIRWQHPERGLLPPMLFLPAIEDHPLAIEIGEWVIDTALTQMALWHEVGVDIPVSVNIGAHQLQKTDFVERLRGILAAHPDMNPACLELEVLETSALEDLAHVSGVIKACREIGVKFALDDFGTGYSSLTYLKQLPVTLLKIDQSFVRDMLDDPDDLAILQGVIGLANAFQRQVIAEGVETIEHGEMLLQLGCELAQGYGIARPMLADNMPGWLTDWHPDPRWANLSLLSRDDLPLLFVGVEHRAWIIAIEAFLEGRRNFPPSLDLQQCHFGQWLDAAGLPRYAGRPAFQSIEALHCQLHVLATELYELRGCNRAAEALARLGELYSLRDAFLERLKVLIQEC